MLEHAKWCTWMNTEVKGKKSHTYGLTNVWGTRHLLHQRLFISFKRNKTKNIRTQTCTCCRSVEEDFPPFRFDSSPSSSTRFRSADSAGCSIAHSDVSFLSMYPTQPRGVLEVVENQTCLAVCVRVGVFTTAEVLSVRVEWPLSLVITSVTWRSDLEDSLPGRFTRNISPLALTSTLVFTCGFSLLGPHNALAFASGQLRGKLQHLFI